jgi:hypothetical protein
MILTLNYFYVYVLLNTYEFEGLSINAETLTMCLAYPLEC